MAFAPFRFLTPFFALCSRLLRNSPRPWVILVIHKIWLLFQRIYHDRLSYHSQFIKNILLTLVHAIILLYATIFYLLGEPISQHLHCCRVFAVKDHSFIPCASHLLQPRLVNNPGSHSCFPKAKSSMSLRPHLNFSKFKQPRLVNNPG